MGKAQDKIRAIASDRRLLPSTRAEKLVPIFKEFGITEKYEGSLLESLKVSLQVQHDITLESSNAGIGEKDEEMLRDAIEILTSSHGEWIMRRDTDITACLRIIRNSSAFKDSEASTRFVNNLITSIESFIEKLKENNYLEKFT